MVAYGDSLITLSILEQLPAHAHTYRLLGSAVTRDVAKLLRTSLPVQTLLDHEAALYTIREHGVLKAYRDFLSLKSGFDRLAKYGDVFAFEFRDTRNWALVPRKCRAMYAGRKHGRPGDSVYEDRRSFINNLLGTSYKWTQSPRPNPNIQKVLINPHARHQSRRLSPETINILANIAERENWSISLIDVSGDFKALQGRVDNYVLQPSLEEACDMLASSQLYIGPDSFFLHLAYYHKVPCFGFFMRNHLIYLPPGMRELNSFIFFDDSRNSMAIEKRLSSFVHGQALRGIG
jgi:hypothetical protein